MKNPFSVVKKHRDDTKSKGRNKGGDEDATRETRKPRFLRRQKKGTNPATDESRQASTRDSLVGADTRKDGENGVFRMALESDDFEHHNFPDVSPSYSLHSSATTSTSCTSSSTHEFQSSDGGSHDDNSGHCGNGRFRYGAGSPFQQDVEEWQFGSDDEVDQNRPPSPPSTKTKLTPKTPCLSPKERTIAVPKLKDSPNQEQLLILRPREQSIAVPDLEHSPNQEHLPKLSPARRSSADPKIKHSPSREHLQSHSPAKRPSLDPEMKHLQSHSPAKRPSLDPEMKHSPSRDGPAERPSLDPKMKHSPNREQHLALNSRGISLSAPELKHSLKLNQILKGEEKSRSSFRADSGPLEEVFVGHTSTNICSSFSLLSPIQSTSPWNQSRKMQTRSSEKQNISLQVFDGSEDFPFMADEFAIGSGSITLKKSSLMEHPKAMSRRRKESRPDVIKTTSLPGGRTALLAIDLQNDFLGDDPHLFFGKLGSPIAPRRDELLSRISVLANEVRAMHGIVIFVRSRYGAWASLDEHRIAMDRMAAAHMGHLDCCAVRSLGSEFHPDAAKLICKEDLVVTKEWYSAFMETILHQVLRRHNVSNLVACGVTTNHSVAATLRSASRLGYFTILSSDGSAQLNPSLQSKTEAKLLPFCGKLLKQGQTVQDAVPKILESAAVSSDTLVVDGIERISGFGAGDAVVVPDFLATKKADKLLERLPKSDKIFYQESSCGVRSAQLLEPNEKGHFPISRHDVQPWEKDYKVEKIAKISTLQKLKEAVEDQSGHSLNWGEIVSHHGNNSPMLWCTNILSDTRSTSSVAVVWLGGQGTFYLRPIQTNSNLAPQRITLYHNSLLLLGPETLRCFTPSKVDFTDEDGNTADSLRLELKFRDLATFYDRESSLRLGVPALYGKGGDFKDHDGVKTAGKTWNSASKWDYLGVALVSVSSAMFICPRQTEGSTPAVIFSVAATAASALMFRQVRRMHWDEQHQLLKQNTSADNN